MILMRWNVSRLYVQMSPVVSVNLLRIIPINKCTKAKDFHVTMCQIQCTVCCWGTVFLKTSLRMMQIFFVFQINKAAVLSIQQPGCRLIDGLKVMTSHFVWCVFTAGGCRLSARMMQDHIPSGWSPVCAHVGYVWVLQFTPTD